MHQLHTVMHHIMHNDQPTILTVTIIIIIIII